MAGKNVEGNLARSQLRPGDPGAVAQIYKELAGKDARAASLDLSAGQPMTDQ